VGKLPNPKRGEVVDVVIGDKVRWCKLNLRWRFWIRTD